MIRAIPKVLTGPRRMLVVLPSWLGDTVMATPTLRALREEFPKAHICYLGRAIPLAVVANAPWADGTIEAGEPGGLSQGAEFLRTVKRIAAGHFDCAVLMPNSLSSALVVTLGKIDRRIGYDRDGRGILLTDRLLPTKENGRFVPGAMIRYYLGLAAYLGARKLDTRMELFTSRADEAAVETMLAEWGLDRGVGMLLVHPGGGFGPSKRWGAEKYAQVADTLGEQFGLEVLISASGAEQDVADVVQIAMNRRAVNLAQKNVSIGQLKSLVRRSRLMISNDTGPRHFAAAFGVPLVTIFGSTDPAWTDTFFEGERIVQAKVNCGPCQKKVCKKDKHICMNLISPQMVLAAAGELLAKGPKRKA